MKLAIFVTLASLILGYSFQKNELEKERSPAQSIMKKPSHK